MRKIYGEETHKYMTCKVNQRSVWLHLFLNSTQSASVASQIVRRLRSAKAASYHSTAVRIAMRLSTVEVTRIATCVHALLVIVFCVHFHIIPLGSVRA